MAGKTRPTNSFEHVGTYGSGGTTRDYSSLFTWENETDLDVSTLHSAGASSVTGVFTLNETINFSPSGAVGVLVAGLQHTGSQSLAYTVSSGTPASGDTITGQSSGKTAVISNLSGAGTGTAVELYDDPGSPYDDYTYVNGASNTTSTRFRTVRAATGQKHNGTPAFGVAINRTSGDGHVIEVADDYTVIADLVLKVTTNSVNNRFPVVMTLAALPVEIWDCIVYDSTNSGAGVNSGVSCSSALGHNVYNCLAHNNEGYGFICVVGAGGYASFWNCVADSNYDGFNLTCDGAGRVLDLYNCVALRNSNADFIVTGGVGTRNVNYCHSGDGTADNYGGSGNTADNGDFSSTEYRNVANDDFRLATSNGVCGGNGIGPGSNSNVPNLGITGLIQRSGSTCAAGIDEYAAQNDFMGDADCVLWSKFAAGLLEREEKTNNNSFWTNVNTVLESTAISPRDGGDGAADFEYYQAERLNRLDADLPAGTPFKSGAGTTFSVCVTLKPEFTASVADQRIVSKLHDSIGGGFLITTEADKKIRFTVYDASRNYDWDSFGTALVIGNRYFISITYDGSTGAYRIHVYDLTNDALLGADVTGTKTYLGVANSDPLYLGDTPTKVGYDGVMDDFLFFKKVLTPTEIANIRQGLYISPLAGLPFGAILSIPHFSRQYIKGAA